MKLFSRHLAIDLGTANIRIFAKGKGIIVDEPSIAAIELADRKHRLLAAGLEAKKMVGRAPDRIQIVRPLREGVVSEFDVFAAMLQYFLKKVIPRHAFVKPDLVFTVPGQITAVEKRALKEAADIVGARQVQLIRNCVAAAVGAGLPVKKPRCSMIVDMGAGKTEIAAISLADIVISRSVLSSGDMVDFSIIQHLKTRHQVVVGQATAEAVKIQTGNLDPAALQPGFQLEVKGRDLNSGIPTAVNVEAIELWEVIAGRMSAVIVELRAALEKIPPELSSDIIDTGLLLTGGMSMMKALDRMIGREIGIPVAVAENPMTAGVSGAGQLLEDPHLLEKISVY
jgi:rod shape-determining protein MreB